MPESFAISDEELRELSLRSRRANAAWAAALGGSMLAAPILVWVADAAPSLVGWIGAAVVALQGTALALAAHVAGKERGAYRLAFRRAKDRAKS